MSHPHTTQLDRDVLEDMQLVDDDRTEDMRLNVRTAPARSSVGALGEGRADPTTSMEASR